MSDKVIFLDIDGVLNNLGWAIKMQEEENVSVFHEDMLEKRAITLLKKIVDQTGADIVMSSTWRFIPDAKKNAEHQLEEFGLSVMDVTPRIPGADRGYEIKEWLINHPQYKHIAILDDDADMAMLMPFLVQTDFSYGLRSKHADLAINVLNMEESWMEGALKNGKTD